MLDTEQRTSAVAGTKEVRLAAETRRNFAVIIPALNEVENVPDLVREFGEVFRKYDLSGDIVLVDDGSTDGTAERARELGVDDLVIVIDVVIDLDAGLRLEIGDRILGNIVGPVIDVEHRLFLRNSRAGGQ